MNIVEAVKSGKRFRRKNQAAWHFPAEDNVERNYLLTTKSILADDWELEERTSTITEGEFDDLVCAIADDFIENPDTTFKSQTNNIKWRKKLFGEGL